MTHPDKGTEMFLYELACDAGPAPGNRQGLVSALADLAAAAAATACGSAPSPTTPPPWPPIRAAGAEPPSPVLLNWSFPTPGKPALSGDERTSGAAWLT